MGKQRNEGEWESKQICVHKSRSSLLELNNLMKPASSKFLWHMHAAGNEGENGTSMIRFVMVDYSKNESVSVYANVLPEHVKYIFTQMSRGVTEFFFAQQKIFRKSSDTLTGNVTCFSISRHEFDENGKKRNYPWYVEIQNGTGIVEKNKSGGQYCKKGSYKMEKKAAIYLTDIDIFVLFCRADSVIKAFERDALFHRRDILNLQKLFKKLTVSRKTENIEKETAA